MGHARGVVEVAKTVLEVADLAFSAVEHLHHQSHHENRDFRNPGESNCCLSAEERKDIRKENLRLKELLEQNLKLLQNISTSPCFRSNCPPDLHERLVAAVDSEKFLSQLQSMDCEPASGNGFPFKEATEADLKTAEILINCGREEPSWWVWVPDDMVRGTEEPSGLDDESYVIVCEEQVVDGIANFIAKCVVSNPKVQKMTPEQLQKIVMSSLSGLNKIDKMLDIWHAGMMFYCLATWGLALAGLYHSRAVLKVAAHGVHQTSKLVLKAL